MWTLHKHVLHKKAEACFMFLLKTRDWIKQKLALEPIIASDMVGKESRGVLHG